MSILIDNKEIGNVINTNEDTNFIRYKELNEVHDNIFLITVPNGQTFLKESKGRWKNKHIVEFNVHTGDKLIKNVKFVLDEKKASCLNLSKYNLIKSKQLVKEDVPLAVEPRATIAAPPIQPLPALPTEQVQTVVQQTLIDFLQNNTENEHFSKFFDKYTDSFKQDVVMLTEKISRREMLRAMEYGGGGGSTVARQYQNGGSMEGSLTVTNTVSAGLLTGSMGVSSLQGGGAADRQVLSWNQDIQQWTPRTTKSVIYLGDGASNIFIANHNLGSMDVVHQVYQNDTNATINAYIQNLDDNSSYIEFANVPSVSAYRIVTIC